MRACLSDWAGSADQRGLHAAALARTLSLLATALVALLVSGCAVMWVANYDKESVDRSTEISKSALKLYQDLLAIDPAKRAAAMAGPLGARHGDVETQIRLHLLREQARAKNSESITIAGNLLASWRKFAANHRSTTDATALSDAVLNIERMELERQLRSAFIAEEAKKLGGGAAQ